MRDFFSADIADADPLISNAIDDEVRRQTNGLELIASENFVSEAVLQAMGTVFTNKYAEGYPGKRYYGGCEFADVVEQAAIDRAKQMFGAEHAAPSGKTRSRRDKRRLRGLHPLQIGRPEALPGPERPRNTQARRSSRGIPEFARGESVRSAG